VRRYVLQRLALMLLSIWVVVTLTFLMMHAVPGDPFTDPKLRPEIKELMMRKYGLDKPLWQQYLVYWSNFLRGEWGSSLYNIGRDVEVMIREGFPESFQVGIQALTWAVIAGIALGTVAALNHNRTWDYVAMVIAVIGVSVPSFVVGVVLQYLLGVKLRLFPIVWDGTFKGSILPSFALGLGTVAVMARMMRTQMLEVLGQDYIRTARAKGLSDTEVVWRHGLRNAILPVLTILGPLFATIVTGTVVIETVFGIPGIGRYYVQSVFTDDYPLILGTTVFYFVFLIISNFLVDLSYGIVDPRIRVGSNGRR